MSDSLSKKSGVPAELARFHLGTTNPHPAWDAGRRHCPVTMRDHTGHESVHVFTREHAERVLGDEATFSARCNQEGMGPYMGEILLGKDGKEHTTYRNLVSRAFRASALQRWEEELIRPTIDELLTAIAPLGRADLVRDVTTAYPTRVIAGIIGVPVEDHAQFHAWAVQINGGPLHPEAGLAASEAMRAYLTPIVEERRARPREDLISDIVHARVDGEQLDDEHIYGFLRLLLPAGAETTYREMGILLLALLQHPEALERLRGERAALPHVIEETLRWESSAPMIARVATRDTEIGGCAVKQGMRVSLSMGSANRDEQVYPHADRWDPGRAPGAPHLAFGWGRHVCLGMHLARLELRVGLEAVLDRLPGLRLDPEQPVPEIQGTAFRGPESLPVLFDATGDGAPFETGD
jgi:cytochrome P450